MPAHRRQQPIAQAGAAEWLQRISGKMRWAIKLEGNMPVDDRKIDAEQPICRYVLELMRYD